jgi:hypothetical protein
MLACMTTQTQQEITVRSGKGASDGVVSELTAFFGVLPGHEAEIREACKRFGDQFLNADPIVHQKVGLRDMKHVLFDDDRRLMLITTFETEWDPYVNDAVTLIGVEHWIDWMRHTTEAQELRAALLGPDAGPGPASSEELEAAVQVGSSELKQLLQYTQVRAVWYFNDLASLTVPQIKKAVRVNQAFQRVLDDPAAARALGEPALAPLLTEAAD